MSERNRPEANDPSFGEFFNPEIARIAAGGEASPPPAPGGSSSNGAPAMSKAGEFTGQMLGGIVRQSM